MRQRHMRTVPVSAKACWPMKSMTLSNAGSWLLMVMDANVRDLTQPDSILNDDMAVVQRTVGTARQWAVVSTRRATAGEVAQGHSKITQSRQHV